MHAKNSSLPKRTAGSENKTSSTLSAGETLLVKLDSSGKYLEVNDAYCELFDRPAEELLGSWFMPLVHPDDRRYTEEMMEKLWRPPFRVDLENRAMTRHGWRWLVWHVDAEVDSVGEVQALVARGRDASETDRQVETCD